MMEEFSPFYRLRENFLVGILLGKSTLRGCKEPFVRGLSAICRLELKRLIY